MVAPWNRTKSGPQGSAGPPQDQNVQGEEGEYLQQQEPQPEPDEQTRLLPPQNAYLSPDDPAVRLFPMRRQTSIQANLRI